MRTIAYCIAGLLIAAAIYAQTITFIATHPAAAGGLPSRTSQWLFDEGSGTTAADSVGSNDFTLNGSPTWGSAWVTYGTSKYASIAHPALEPDFANDDFSLCMSLRATSVTTRQFVFSKMTNGGTYPGYNIEITTASKLRFEVGTPTSSSNRLRVEPTASISTSTWYFFCATASSGLAASNVEVWMDGVSATKTTVTDSYNPAYETNVTATTYISGIGASFLWFTGDVGPSYILVGGTKWDSSDVAALCADAETELENAGETPAWGCN